MPETPKRRSPKRPTPKPRTPKPKPREKVAPGDVTLVRAKGTKGKGGGPGGHAWVIRNRGARAGTVFINLIDEQPVGPHASIQIYLNQPSQGRGIGRIAYRMASEESGLGTIYAHMQKANHASRRAAEEAGYVDASPPGHTQLLMRWTRAGA